MTTLRRGTLHRYSVSLPTTGQCTGDPVMTEIVRNALHSGAKQMARVLLRTAFSTVVTDGMDFAAAIYDGQYQLMAQSTTLPVFLGTLGFCVEAAVNAVGGAEQLDPGDILVYNFPFGTGSHPQDVAIVAPCHWDGRVVGYICNKAHWSDIGAKDSYCTDTTDLFQEGVIFPGLKLYRRGVKNEDLFAMIRANSRMPKAVEGDLAAQISSARFGVDLVAGLISRFQPEVFWNAVQHMYAHAESTMRAFIATIPDGRYTAHTLIDSDGVDDVPIGFDVSVEVAGSTIRFDFSDAPPAVKGPMNQPLPGTVGGCRVLLSMMAGGNLPANEGLFRPLEVVTRVGSMFHPLPPAPTYLYGWPLENALEAALEALGTAVDGLVPAGSAGDIVSVGPWSSGSETEEPYTMGGSLPVGQGGHRGGDGATLQIASMAFAKMVPIEVEEAMYPVLYDETEFIPDSAGHGQYRGGVGYRRSYTMTRDALFISTIERTRHPGQGQRGGGPGLANRCLLVLPDGTSREVRKVTSLPIAAGTQVVCETGGGGGYGSASQREPSLVERDLRNGLITEESARKRYPHYYLLRPD